MGAHDSTWSLALHLMVDGRCSMILAAEEMKWLTSGLLPNDVAYLSPNRDSTVKRVAFELAGIGSYSV